MNKEDVYKQWEFSFDIKQSALANVYGRKSTTYAYAEIGRFLFRRGFDNKDEKQGSCYFTSKKMRYSAANKIIHELFDEFPWLSECIRKCALYEKPKVYNDYNQYCAYLNNSEAHKIQLEEYYERIGIKMQIDIQTNLAERGRSTVKNNMAGKNNIMAVDDKLR